VAFARDISCVRCIRRGGGAAKGDSRGAVARLSAKKRRRRLLALANALSSHGL